MVLCELLGVKSFDSVRTRLLPGLKQGGNSRLGRNGKNGMDMVGHDHKTVTKRTMRFETGLQGFQDNASCPFRGQKLAPLISGESHKMKLSWQINDLAFAHPLASCGFAARATSSPGHPTKFRRSSTETAIMVHNRILGRINTPSKTSRSTRPLPPARKTTCSSRSVGGWCRERPPLPRSSPWENRPCRPDW